MRRERGSTVAVRASSVANGEVARLNADIGLPKEGPGGALCPLDAGHCDAKFMKVLSVKDPKLISERERNDLMEGMAKEPWNSQQSPRKEPWQRALEKSPSKGP